MWRGDRGALLHSSGKGQEGVVAVYLIKMSSVLKMGGARLAAGGTGVWWNTRTTPSAAWY